MRATTSNLKFAALLSSAAALSAAVPPPETLGQVDKSEDRGLFRQLRIGEKAAAKKGDFCSFNGRFNLIIDRPVGATDVDAVEITRQAKGVDVVLAPEADIHDAHSAVNQLSMFLSDASRVDCAQIENLWPVLSTTVRGLRIINRDGQMDFEFESK